MSQPQEQDAAKVAEQQAAEEMNRLDSLVSYLHHHVASIGISEQVFALDSIDRLLSQVHTANADAMQQEREQLKTLTEEAFMTYAKGQRYGFVNPNKLYKKDDYDVTYEQPDSAFLAAAHQAFATNAACQFLDSCQPSAKAYQQLLEAYKKDSTEAGRKQIALNMERLRWRDPNQPAEDERHILVNIPAQQVWAITKDSTFSMKICCGSPSKRTPMLTSAIRLIEVNPEWNIPYSIIRNEVSHRAGDSAYFARNAYYITDRSGKKVDPKSLSQSDLRSGSYRIAQRSGAGNSLGRLIFRFNNRFSVYLHDTNNKSAFKNERRTVSHGCVRLERPFDMALLVLPDADPWLFDRIRLSIDMKPETERGINYVKEHKSQAGRMRLINSTDVTPNVPLQINYFTVYPNPETGVIETWPDRYSYDKTLETALKPFLR